MHHTKTKFVAMKKLPLVSTKTCDHQQFIYDNSGVGLQQLNIDIHTWMDVHERYHIHVTEQ